MPVVERKPEDPASVFSYDGLAIHGVAQYSPQKGGFRLGSELRREI
jgi:hypothetical protein